jgi:ABC-type spermidine/putrescine transport system permease subunit II
MMIRTAAANAFCTTRAFALGNQRRAMSRAASTSSLHPVAVPALVAGSLTAMFAPVVATVLCEEPQGSSPSMNVLP